jgi:hypothetical protein
MRRQNVDREDDPALGIRILKPQDQSAKSTFVNHHVGARKGPAIADLWEKVLAKHYAIRRPLAFVQISHPPTQASAMAAR